MDETLKGLARTFEIVVAGVTLVLGTMFYPSVASAMPEDSRADSPWQQSSLDPPLPSTKPVPAPTPTLRVVGLDHTVEISGGAPHPSGGLAPGTAPEPRSSVGP
jgi:hypothetical protein